MNQVNLRRRKMALLEYPILQENGIIFDACSLGFTVGCIEGRLPRYFQLPVRNQTFWVKLDLKQIVENTTENILEQPLEAQQTHSLILPSKDYVLNARGKIERGLCLTHVDDLRSISVPYSLKHHTSKKSWIVRPVAYHLPLTYGIVTELTSKSQIREIMPVGDFGDLATTKCLSTIFYIPIDIGSWPVLIKIRDKSSEKPHGQSVALSYTLIFLTWLIFLPIMIVIKVNTSSWTTNIVPSILPDITACLECSHASECHCRH